MTEERPAIVCLIVSERRGCMHSQMHTDRAGFSVFSCARKLLSHSVSVTDEHALKGIGLKWFTITWALRLWSQTAACAVLQRYYIIYNDIIDHYVFWHSTLSQLWFINQMMKGGCNSEIKGKQEKTQTWCQQAPRLFSLQHHKQCHFYRLCFWLINSN